MIKFEDVEIGDVLQLNGSECTVTAIDRDERTVRVRFNDTTDTRWLAQDELDRAD